MEIHPQTHQHLPESTVLACVAQCYETAEFYAARGERGLFDWWSNQGDRIAERLAVYRDIQAALVASSCGVTAAACATGGGSTRLCPSRCARAVPSPR